MKFLKIISIFSLFIAFFIISFFIYILVYNKYSRLKYNIKNTHLFAKLFLKLCGVKIYINGLEKPIINGSLIISNHLSYLDIVLISSILPVVFISSMEVKETPILGLFARCGGSIFIERRKKTTVHSDINKIEYFLSKGFSILLFPEGTTSNGDYILPFKSSLLGSVINKNVTIENLCIKYSTINGNIINNNNRDYIYYYGDMTFWPHFFNLLGLQKIEVEIQKAGRLNAKNFSSRKELVNLSHKLIAEKY
jgi:1-acyl-sn-glycerol-3-phosphate acyltransferase